MMPTKGSIYLIPTYLSPANDSSFISPMVTKIVEEITHFLVEDERTARRFISSLKLGVTIPDLHFEVLDKHTTPEVLEKMMLPALNGLSMGILSEAGLPCLADPGNMAVSYAHQKGIRVIPLPGASSIQTALIASGFNGQQFTFHGYLSLDKGERILQIQKMENTVRQTGYTQLFMETPYRNTNLLEDLKKTCAPKTLLSVSRDLFGKHELVKTLTVSQWKKNSIDLHKIPAVFSLGQYSWSTQGPVSENRTQNV